MIVKISKLLQQYNDETQLPIGKLFGTIAMKKLIKKAQGIYDMVMRK